MQSSGESNDIYIKLYIMKKSLLVSGALALFSFTSFATILRVNNTLGVNAGYNDLQPAITAASAGDTIHLEPSLTSYGSATVDRKVTIIGSGFFNNAAVTGGLNTMNPNLQATNLNSIINNISFYPGSEQSTLMGCSTGNIQIFASDITIKRNYIGGWFYLNNYNPNTGVYGNYSNLDIRQNVFWIGMSVYYFSNAGGIGYSNINIQNNIFYAPSSQGISLPVGASGYIQNNTFDVYGGYSALNCYGFQVDNNVIVNGTFTPNNCVYFNNIGSSTQFGTANSNQQNVSTATLYTNYAGANETETRYDLAPAGPGVGAGFGGIDVGSFGGPDPYRLSGIPPVPSIYLLTAPATTTTSTLPVTISTRSNN
jgi:hypothetical protein